MSGFIFFPTCGMWDVVKIIARLFVSFLKTSSSPLRFQSPEQKKMHELVAKGTSGQYAVYQKKDGTVKSATLLGSRPRVSMGGFFSLSGFSASLLNFFLHLNTRLHPVSMASTYTLMLHFPISISRYYLHIIINYYYLHAPLSYLSHFLNHGTPK